MSESKKFVLEESTYQVINGEPEIILFGRNYEDKFKTAVHVVKGFKPYFYAPAHERHYDHLITHYGPHVEIDALGREVRKCYTRVPSDVPKVRDKFEFTDMADFLFEKRYLVDTGIKYAYEWDSKRGIATPVDVPSILMPRIVYFDIEVLAPESVLPLPFNPNYPVVSIQVMDSYTKKIVVFTNGLPCKCADDHMECGSEAKLFRAFQAYLKAIDPDIVSGWSVSQYDYPYLIKRAQTIGVSVSGLGRWGKPYTEYVKRKKKASWRSIIKGRSTIDMLEMFKKLMVNKGQRESNALKEVSKDYGFEYVDYGAKLQRLFDDGGWDTFLQYCRNDVISLDLIDNHKDLKMYETYEYLRMISGTRLDDTLYNTKLIEMYSLHDGMKPMPTKHYNEDEEEEEKYEGAFVMLPPVGVHENVGAVDIASLYPNIMRAFPEESSPDVDRKVVDVVDTFLTEREKYRTLRKNGDDSSKTAMVENAYKVLGNSVYGWVGSKSGRLFNEKCAEFITGTGRKINEYIRDCLLDKYGKKTLYGDTDSNFFEIVMSPEEGLEIQDNLNQDLIRWGNEHNAKITFSLKFEKLFKTIMFKQSSGKKGVAKKKYCGRMLWEEGRTTDEFSSKGIELRRSDQARITKTCLFKFLDLVLMETKIDEALKYVHEMYKRSLDGDMHYREASIPKMIRSFGNKSPHARGIENTKTYYHYNIPDGVKPRLLYLKGSIKEICIDDEFELDPVTIENIDWEQMTESNITKKMKSYIESLGYKWDVVIHGQTSLDRFR